MGELKSDCIRIRLKAFDHKLLDQEAQKIVQAVKRTSAKVCGPIPLPTKRSRYCVIRSPFIDKESMEHYEMRVHKRMIDIIGPEPRTVDALMKLDIPSGVDIEIKLP